MKKQKRILTAIAVLLLCITASLPMANAEIILLPQTTQLISNANVLPDPQGGGWINTQATISCIGNVDSIGFISIRLQENHSGTWVTVKSATSKFITNASSYSYTITYLGTPGMSYRALASFSATDNGITETRSKTSITITCY